MRSRTHFAEPKLPHEPLCGDWRGSEVSTMTRGAVTCLECLLLLGRPRAVAHGAARAGDAAPLARLRKR